MSEFSSIKLAAFLLLILILAYNEKGNHRKIKVELPAEDNYKVDEKKLKKHS